MSNLVFVYGTLKNSEPNHHVMQNGGEGADNISLSEKDQLRPALFHSQVIFWISFFTLYMYCNGSNRGGPRVWTEPEKPG